MAMPLYKIAFILSGLLLVPLAFMQVMMRRQVHNANYGVSGAEISPWDLRFVNAIFGKYGIWNLHKKAYERSALRSSFMIVGIAWLAVVLFAALGFVLARR